jgi:threonine dehydrogenase-like Zn-dependent dehydrogenase
MYIREDVERAIALIDDGLIPLHRLITAEFPLAQAAEAFRTAGAQGTASVKVHLHPQR